VHESFYGATINKKLFASQIKHTAPVTTTIPLQTPRSRSQRIQVKSLRTALLAMKIAKRQCNFNLYHNTHPPKKHLYEDNSKINSQISTIRALSYQQGMKVSNDCNAIY